jgi:hypothetical protein
MRWTWQRAWLDPRLVAINARKHVLGSLAGMPSVFAAPPAAIT